MNKGSIRARVMVGFAAVAVVAAACSQLRGVDRSERCPERRRIRRGRVR